MRPTCLRFVTPAVVLLIFIFLTAPPVTAQVTWYVDDDAPGDPGPGTPELSDPLEDGSAAHPFDAIQEGIDAAAGGDTVLVRDGTYSGTGNYLVDFSGKAILVRSENGAEHCDIDGDGPTAGGVVFENGEEADSILRGFSIHHVSSEHFVISSPIRMIGASPIVEENTIIENVNHSVDQYGSAIYCQDSQAIIRNNVLSGNELWTGRGGGIYCRDSNPSILSNSILDGHSLVGGGIYCSSSSPKIMGNLISGNTCDYYGGAGIYLVSSSSPLISGNTIVGNTIVEGGDGGGIHCGSGCDPRILNNVISGNNRGYTDILAPCRGGGISCASGAPVITGNVITENIVYTSLEKTGGRDASDCFGAGIACLGSASPTITNNVVVGNYLTGSSSRSGFGGGLYCGPDTSPVAINNTILRNHGREPMTHFGLGIYCESSLAVIENCIVRDNQGEQIEGCEGLVSYCNVEGGYAGTGNIDADPLFVAGPDGCFYLSHTATGQAADSPCVDAGSGPAAAVCFASVDDTICLDGLTTRIDQVPDTGIADMGYHHGGGVIIPCPPTVGAGLDCVPSSGTLPFSCGMSVTLENLFDDYKRKVAVKLHLTVAGGAHYDNWRGGRATVGAGEVLVFPWAQGIPLLNSLVGDNLFELAVEDVTPAPFNRPPYPPAGDTAADNCTVNGISP